MRFFTAVLAALALASPIFAAPTSLRTVEKFSGETSGKFIVKLKAGASKSLILKLLKGGSSVTDNWKLFNGFAGKHLLFYSFLVTYVLTSIQGTLDDDTLNILRASPDVEYISEDGIMHTMVQQ